MGNICVALLLVVLVVSGVWVSLFFLFARRLKVFIFFLCFGCACDVVVNLLI